MNGIPGLYFKKNISKIDSKGGNEMNLSIDSTKITLYPIKGSKSYIDIENGTGKVNLGLVKTNLSNKEIDKIIEHLTLAKQISNEIIGK